ncbi:MAG: hypothetical protein JWN80_873 [Microbacteriaceae bacterium]|jgi:hypothetical protein|nr:hypothetical protein [Microbacteriaceae bacterium]
MTDEEPQPEPVVEQGSFDRKKAKRAPRPNALADDGRAPDERALDPFTDDDLHRAN